jgi:hypothetical protein
MSFAAAARTPRSATHDPVVLAAEAMLSSVVDLLRFRGHEASALALESVAGNDRYVSRVVRCALADANDGGRDARLAKVLAVFGGG